MSGIRNSRERATSPRLVSLTAIKRQSSNSVKMLKIAASATKQTIKLNTSERSSVASIKFGKRNVATPMRERRPCPSGVFSAASFLFFRRNARKENGVRLMRNNNKLKPMIKKVASHGPTYGERVPTRDIDSPKSETRE